MLRIGTSGWQYRHWKGVLYPEGVSPRAWFDVYAGRFDTVEVNATFYRLPASSTFEAWGRRVSGGFLYALKFSRYGSHLKRLLEPEAAIEVFVKGARLLGPSLGPVLVQLPPRWHAAPARLDAFLAAAPRDLRWAVEFRDPSWLVPQVFDILRRHGAALCVHDKIPGHPDEPTAEWVYLRYHGHVPGGRYGTSRLRPEARRIRRWLARGLDVYAYFNNDPHGHAVRDALRLKELTAPASARRSAASRTPGRSCTTRTAGSRGGR